MSAVFAEGPSLVAWRTVGGLCPWCQVCEAALIAFVALTLGEEAATRYVWVPTAVASGAGILLGELEAKVGCRFGAAAGAGVATSDSEAA